MHLGKPSISCGAKSEINSVQFSNQGKLVARPSLFFAQVIEFNGLSFCQDKSDFERWMARSEASSLFKPNQQAVPARMRLVGRDSTQSFSMSAP